MLQKKVALGKLNLMKSTLLKLITLFFVSAMMAQTGHVLQGIGAKNLSMGGAATGNALDISGAIHWNPASISAFDTNQLKVDIGFFFSAPELSSTVPEFVNGIPTGNFFSGTTQDDRGISVMPNIAYTWGKENSKHRYAVSAFGISGFGVTFPENMANPINAPQAMGGFGRIESDYALLQMAFTWSYQLSENLAFGIAPTLNYATLELMPNPTANPTMAGYPSSDKTSSFGYGAQVGLYYDSKTGFSSGISYKTNQSFGEFEFDNTYLDSTTGNSTFEMDYPSILSLGVGYSKNDFDLAVDYRLINYENTEGFDQVGWSQTASVTGFGWKNVNVVSAGIQYKGIDKFPLRLGYTYSSNPIDESTAFFNVPATAIIKNAYQFGFGYKATDKLSIDFVYHHGTSSGDTVGPLYNPQFIGMNPPYGAIPNSEVRYNMTTDMLMFGVSYNF